MVEKPQPQSNDAGIVLEASDDDVFIEEESSGHLDSSFVHPFDASSNADFTAKCLPYNTTPPTRSPWYVTLDDDGGVIALYHCPGAELCYDDTLNHTIQCI